MTYSIAQSQICVGEAGVLKWQCWQNLFDSELGELSAEEDFPNRPDFSQNIFRTQSPINFDNQMGSRIHGFISVGQTDDVIFNVTGDDIVRFYLSTDENPDNVVLQAFHDGFTGVEEHDKYPEQTSGLITLTAGEFYYFELLNIEGSGGDHITLWWETINDDPTEWKIITSEFIHGVDCLDPVCPERGTACDDGDATTTDDVEDGFCNCHGTPETTNSCIGEKAHINMYVYDTIPGGALNDLFTDPSFPGMPTSSKTLHYLSEPWKNDVDSVGNLIQAFLNVPVTGNYKFNITGNNECIFFISSDETPANKQAHQIIVTGSTNPVEHDKYIWQNTSNLYLEKEKYYYIELNHKEGTFSEHFGVFWQTPFTEPDTWKRIPEFYLYDYECEIACIPQGNPCDDGDPFTNNDQYDANCNCIGTPCSGPDCNDPIASYSYYPKCDLTDQLDNRSDNNWLSCTESASPNPSRGSGHWIMYDFNQDFVMQESQVWNYNAAGFEQGFEEVAIDYSSDGTNWTTLGLYNWPLSDGASEYSGFMGPDFNEVVARYVLITSLTPGQSCRGFGKILINASLCTNSGTPCNDNNPFTINDVINESCVCEGTNTAFNECLTDTLSLGDTLIIADVHSAIELVESENTIGSNGYVVYISGDEISLEPGFETVLGSNFEAFIELCTTSADDDNDNDELLKSKKPNDILKVLPIPDTDTQIIEFYLDEPGQVKIDIVGKDNKEIINLLDVEFINGGIFQKYIRTFKLEPGVYNVIYTSAQGKELEKITVQ